MGPERRYGLLPGPAIARPYLDELNLEQRAAVLSDASRLLILAGAGTGKTRTLTARVARLVGDGVPAEAIILLTFSRRAAAMMIERLAALLGDSARRVRAGTFHALAYRALTEAQRARPTILDAADQEELIHHARLVTGLDVPLSSGALAAIHSHGINAGVSLGDAILAKAPEAIRHEDAVTTILAAYQAQKAQMGLFDYDDLLLGWQALLGTPEGQSAQARIRHVLVDEYQDTNPLQADLAEKLAAGKHLAVVGDDAQSIYGFRGARFELILDFPRQAKTEVTQLTLNYRSDPAILTVANRVIADNPLQFPKALRSERESRLLPAWVPAKDSAEEARFVAQRALELVAEGIPLSEQAVLFRAHSHGVELELELTRRSIPYVVRAGLRFFEQAHVRDLLAYLRILANPRDNLAWSRALRMVPGIGIKTGAAALAQLAQSDDVGAALAGLPGLPGLRAPAKSGLVALKETLGPWLAGTPRPGDVIRHLLGPDDPVGLGAHVGAQSEGRRRRSELEQLASLADREPDLRTFLSELVLDQDVGGAADRPVTGTERLTLSTVHQAKGLEWRAVFIIGLSDGNFPSKSALFEAGGEAEERRLFYVGVTRAMEQLYLVQPTTRMVAERETLILRPSRFLEALEPALMERWQLS